MEALKRAVAAIAAVLAFLVVTVGISVPANAQISYNGQVAAQFALQYATSEQPLHFSGCAWFASNALWAGGLPQSDQWNPDGLKGTVVKTPGTVAATAAPELISYLLSGGLASELDLNDRFATNAVSEARPGDLIVYDWEGDGVYDHISIVVAITSGDYPEVAEWGTATNWPTMTSSYTKRGWTWSANSNTWLRAVYGNAVTAKLLMIGR